MKKTLAIVVSAALLVAAQGPAAQALAQVHTAVVASPSPVRAVPAGLALPPIGVPGQGPGTVPFSGALPALGALPAPLVPHIVGAAAQAQAASVAAPHPGPKAPESPLGRIGAAAPVATARQAGPLAEAANVGGQARGAEQAAPAAEPRVGAAEQKPGGLRAVWDKARRAFGFKSKAAPAREQPDYQGRFLQRVIDIANRLEDEELGRRVPAEPRAGAAEASRDNADGAWEGASQGQAGALTPAPVQARASGGAAPVESVLSAPKPQEPGAGGIRSRAPPKPAPVQALENAAGGLKSAFNRWFDQLSGPVRVALVAAASAAADFGAQALLPGLFGFSAAASLWVVAGLGSVVMPILLFDRLRLAKVAEEAARPLKRHEDGLLGLMTGAAVVTAVGAALSPVSLKALLVSSTLSLPGVFPLAPFLGLLALMAAFPLLYSSGHVLYGLVHRRIVTAVLPLPFLFKLLLFPLLVMPGRAFAMLLGPLAFPALASYAAVGTLLAYFHGGRKLIQMTVNNASPDEFAREKAYEAEPDLRGLLEPEPSLGPEWRVGNGEPVVEREQAAVGQAKRSAAFWLAAIPLLSIGLFALHSLSFAPLLAAVPGLGKHLVLATVMVLLSSVIAPLISRAKRVHEGPLVDTVRELAQKAGLPMPKVYAAEDKSGSPNAFASGALHRMSVVAVLGSIRSLLTDREFRGVLGHELSHVKYRHMLSFLVGIVSLQLLSFGASTILQLFLAAWAPVAWTLAFMGVMRANEKMADAGGALLLNDPRGLATGLRKMGIMSLLKGKVPDTALNWLYKGLLSHPPVSDRVKALNGMMERR